MKPMIKTMTESDIIFDDFLPDSCPPAEAKQHDGEIYRFVFTEDKSKWEIEFTPYFIKCRDKVEPGKECQACGLSSYLQLDIAEEVKEKIPYFRKKAIIVKGIIKSTDGLILNTPSNTSDKHYTWWVSRQSSTLQLFSVLSGA